MKAVSRKVGPFLRSLNPFRRKKSQKSQILKAAVCYLNGRNELRADVEGALRMVGERNYFAQLTSDLIERRQNKDVVDLVDIGTELDMRRFANYQGDYFFLFGM